MQLSVIIPVYNVEKYVARAIESVLQNDLPPGSFEIIVVNDGSADGSLAIVERFAAQQPMIKIISQTNKGLGGARNTGIEHARGNYILFLDADDWINPGMLAQTVGYALQAQVDVLEFGAEGIMPDGKIAYRKSLSSNGQNYDGFTYALKFDYMWSACNKLYRTGFLKDHALYFTEQIYFEDLEFYARLIPKVSKIQAIPEIVASFYQSGDSITRHNSEAKKQKAYRDIVTIITRLHDQLMQVDAKDRAARKFYLQYLGILVVTLFFQFVKNGENAQVAVSYRDELRKKNMYYTKDAIVPFQKDLFRRILLNNFTLLKILLNVKSGKPKPE